MIFMIIMIISIYIRYPSIPCLQDPSHRPGHGLWRKAALGEAQRSRLPRRTRQGAEGLGAPAARSWRKMPSFYVGKMMEHDANSWEQNV